MKLSMMTIMKMIATDSSSVVKCYWNNVEFKCDGSFINHVDTLGSCFTFNLNEDIINAAAVNNGKESTMRQRRQLKSRYALKLQNFAVSVVIRTNQKLIDLRAVFFDTYYPDFSLLAQLCSASF